AGAEAGAARTREPARHPLDGPLRTRRRDPRDARRRLDRVLPLPRLHPDAHLRCGVAVRARRGRNDRLHRAGLMRMPLKLAAQVAAVGVVAALLALLAWRLVHDGHAVTTGPAPRFTLPRLDGHGDLGLASLRG